MLLSVLLGGLLSGCQAWDRGGPLISNEPEVQQPRQKEIHDPGVRLIAEAKRYYKEGQVSLAFEVLEVAIRSSSDKASVYLEYAQMLVEQGMLERALEMDRRALTLSDDKRQRRRISKRIDSLERELGIQPDD